MYDCECSDWALDVRYCLHARLSQECSWVHGGGFRRDYKVGLCCVWLGEGGICASIESEYYTGSKTPAAFSWTILSSCFSVWSAPSLLGHSSSLCSAPKPQLHPVVRAVWHPAAHGKSVKRRFSCLSRGGTMTRRWPPTPLGLKAPHRTSSGNHRRQTVRGCNRRKMWAEVVVRRVSGVAEFTTGPSYADHLPEGEERHRGVRKHLHAYGITWKLQRRLQVCSLLIPGGRPLWSAWIHTSPSTVK